MTPSGTPGAVTVPAASELAPDGVESAPGICAHFSQFTGARAKEELAQEPIDGRDVISRPPCPECRIPGQWLDRLVGVELCRDATQQIIDLRHVIPPTRDQESSVPDLFAGHWPGLMTGPGHKRRAAILACHEQKCAASHACQARLPVNPQRCRCRWSGSSPQVNRCVGLSGGVTVSSRR